MAYRSSGIIFILLVSTIADIVVVLTLIHFAGLYDVIAISTAVAFFVMAVYRHFDLKKYVKIKYRLPDLVMAVLGLIGISAIYYSGNIILYVIGAMLAAGYAIVINLGIIKKTFVKFANKVKFR